jgi:hypothetical protein
MRCTAPEASTTSMRAPSCSGISRASAPSSPTTVFGSSFTVIGFLPVQNSIELAKKTSARLADS